jgi:hypothetical protein
LNEIGFEIFPVVADPFGIEIVSVEIAKSSGNFGSALSPIYKIIAPKDIVGAGILEKVAGV